MKSERRHQLERNVLADQLGAGLASVQSILPMILGGLAILAVGSIAWGFYSTSARKKESVAWTEYYFNVDGGDADSFMDVAELYPSSSAAGWARQTAGDRYLDDGVRALYRNRSEGEELIRQALDAYEGVLSKSPGDELRAKALIGLAHAHESLGQLSDATTYYKQYTAVASAPNQIRAANERLAFLNSDEGKNFYAWFSKLDPKPDAAIELPANLALPPTQPDIQFGELGDLAPGGTIDPSTLPELPGLKIQPNPDSDPPSGIQPPAVGPVDIPEPESAEAAESAGTTESTPSSDGPDAGTKDSLELSESLELNGSQEP